ncbi:hypothetical protein Tco_0355154 [Tanacetum coccineum]
MEYVKKSIDKRALHKRDYDSRVNERQMQTAKEKVDTSKSLNASLVDTESSETEFKKQDTRSRSGNDADADNANIKPVDQNAEQCHDIRPLPTKLTDNQITVLSNQSLESGNICLKKTVARFQKDFSKLEAHCINLKLKYQNQALKEGQHGQFSKFASQVDVNNDLSKLVTTHYLSNERESAFAKPYHVIASSESRNSSENMPRFSSNDMVHNHYLEEAKKKTQERGKIFESSTTKIDSDPPHGSNTDITNLQECIQTLDPSAGTSINVQEKQNLDSSAGVEELKRNVWIKGEKKEALWYRIFTKGQKQS